MADELPVEDGAPAPSESTTDWEQRYKDTHANWNSLNERMSRFEKDPNALIEFIQEKHPDLLAEDDEPEDTYEEPDEDEQPLTRAEWKQWQAEQAQAAQVNAASQQFEADLKNFTGDRELGPQGDAFVRYAASKGDIKGPDDLKKSIADWFEYEDGLKATAKPKPRVPHVPANGQAATEVPDWSGMSQREINKYMAEKAQSQLQG